MKVLEINSVCGIRSTGRICTDIADILLAQGHEVKILYGREIVPAKHQKYAVRIGNETSVKINALKARILDNEGFNAKYATKKAIEFIKEYKPDIIHLHNLHGYYINIELLFNYLVEAAIPVICTMHDCWMFTGHCAYFSSSNCEKWKTGCNNCVQKKYYPSSYLLDGSIKNWTQKKSLFEKINMTLVTPSQWLADLVSDSFLKNNNIRVINNGIDVDHFSVSKSSIKKDLGIENGKMILGVASAWGENKGLNDFIQLSNIINPQDRIVLVGLTEKQKLELPKSIIGITRTNSIDELATLYSAADVFVNPTHHDNFPTVNLEARACGTPIITYNAGGSPESAGKDATVVEIGDIEGLKAAIDLIPNNTKLKVNKDTLSREYMAKQYLEIYKEQINVYSNKN